jgi:cytochrome c oxidase assembly protein subunit 11
MTNGESQDKISTQERTSANDASVKKTVKKLMLIVFGMFGFGFAMVPLYDVFCDITGLNGKTSNVAASYSGVTIDTERTITVQFLTRTAKGIPWRFEPMINEVKVHPGERKTVKFYAKNESVSDIVGQAVPSVSPGKAAVYFQKIECFCFNNQPLKASEDVEMGLQFYVDLDIPEDVSTITLSYTLYDITSSVDS